MHNMCYLCNIVYCSRFLALIYMQYNIIIHACLRWFRVAIMWQIRQRRTFINNGEQACNTSGHAKMFAFRMKGKIGTHILKWHLEVSERLDPKQGNIQNKRWIFDDYIWEISFIIFLPANPFSVWICYWIFLRMIKGENGKFHRRITDNVIHVICWSSQYV